MTLLDNLFGRTALQEKIADYKARIESLMLDLAAATRRADGRDKLVGELQDDVSRVTAGLAEAKAKIQLLEKDSTTRSSNQVKSLSATQAKLDTALAALRMIKEGGVNSTNGTAKRLARQADEALRVIADTRDKVPA